MPSKSPAQHRLMEAVSHNPAFAKKAGIPQSVGRDFAAADDKAGITKTHGGKPVGSPRSKEEHMERLSKHQSQKSTGRDFGVSQSTVSRKTMKRGFMRGGSAKS